MNNEWDSMYCKCWMSVRREGEADLDQAELTPYLPASRVSSSAAL